MLYQVKKVQPEVISFKLTRGKLLYMLNAFSFLCFLLLNINCFKEKKQATTRRAYKQNNH